MTVCGPFTKGEMERGEKSFVIREQYRWYDCVVHSQKAESEKTDKHGYWRTELVILQ